MFSYIDQFQWLADWLVGWLDGYMCVSVLSLSVVVLFCFVVGGFCCDYSGAQDVSTV